jgi:squalene cyclase
VAKLQRRRRANGSYEQLVNRSAFAVLAQRAAGRRADPKTVRWLLSQQNTDGGWSLGGKGGDSGVDDTAAVVQALASAGRRSSSAVRRATRWLERRQGPDGGFPLTPASPPTPSRRRSSSRAWSPAGATSSACGATAAARRWATCARCRPRTAASGTRAPAARRPCG